MAAANFSQRWLRPVLLGLSSFSNRLANKFYIALAIIIGALAIYAMVTGATSGMKNKAYDLIMKSRFHYPAADPNIVIVDIDESALAAMAPEYGRWPWPRNIMGELVEGIAAQKPQAIVFDISFSDPDVFNAAGDKFFRDVIARTPNTFFPSIRLDESNDHLSQFKVKQLPGVTKLDDSASDSATMAVILPFFFDALKDHRLGTINIYTDEDGLARTYDVYADEYGWRVSSLPANVVSALGTALPDRQEILINWRGKPPAYAHVSFSDIYFDLQKQKKTRPPNEFADKIVIIGSTAATLFDIKTTPVAKLHPGVEILATAIDNLKHADYLTELPYEIYIFISLVAIVLLTVAFVYNIDQRVVNLTFTVLQTGFLAVSYLTLNFSTVFVDLTAPFTFSLLYFTIARFNSTFTGFYRSGHPLFSKMLDDGSECRVIFAQCHIHIKNRNARLRLGATFKRYVGASEYGVVTPPFFKGLPVLHAFFQHTLIFYWLVPKQKEIPALQDLISMLEQSIPAVRKSARRHARANGSVVTWLLHGFVFTVDAEEVWRLHGEEGMAKLFAETSAVGSTGSGGVMHIAMTKEFARFCQTTDLKISDELRNAGLKCN
ncbi:MAG: CHASE2 domain-containing protein [Gammaproteobacteria bacterium]|nr:CHASE2 domain-containing protein [Gammaproteobacteria bacterium]